MVKTKSAIILVILIGFLAILFSIGIFALYGGKTTSVSPLEVTSLNGFAGFEETPAPIINFLKGISGSGSSSGDSNDSPTADAGADQTVNEGATVTLDASDSTDSDGDTLTYGWTQIGTQTVILSSKIVANPTFTAPSVSTQTTLTFQLIVNDGELSSSDTVIITVNDLSSNTIPVANAGLDIMVNELDLVALNGTASSDADSDTLTYLWSQTAGPSVVLDESIPSTPTFTAPSVFTQTTLTFQLIVNDGTVNSNQDTVDIIVNYVAPPNNAPVASDISSTLDEDTTLVINLACTDADSDPLIYSIVSNPSDGVLTGTGSSRTYIPSTNFFGSDSFTYRCNDGTDNSNTATVSITVNAINDAPVVAIPDVTFAEDSSIAIDLDSYVTDVDNTNSQISWTVSGGTEVNVAINSVTNVATFTASTNWNGNEVLTFTANDGTDTTSDPVTVTVTPVDDPTVWSTLTNKYVDEDSPDGTVVYYGLAGRVIDIDGPSPTITVVSTHTHFNLAMSGLDLVISGLEADWYGTETVVLSANGASANFDFTVNQLLDECITTSSYGASYTICD